jgi:hypothetical protein
LNRQVPKAGRKIDEPKLNPKNGGGTHALEDMYFEASLWTWPNLETENLKFEIYQKLVQHGISSVEHKESEVIPEINGHGTKSGGIEPPAL